MLFGPHGDGSHGLPGFPTGIGGKSTIRELRIEITTKHAIARSNKISFGLVKLTFAILVTIDERISRVILRAVAHRLVVHHLTLRLQAANAVTRIDAFVIRARLRMRTVRVDDTLRMAS